jgi:hypothetical protein
LFCHAQRKAQIEMFEIWGRRVIFGQQGDEGVGLEETA